MQRIAISKGGDCLSTAFKNVDTKLTWKCSCGNIWDALPQSIIRGTWCKKCGNKRINQARKLSLEKMKAVAFARGGDCLSLIYENNDKLLKWICEEGHIWYASASHISRGSWCRKCVTAKSRIPITKLHDTAKQKGGKLLSTEYKTNKDFLSWQCNNGHIWKAKANTILSGFWCPICPRFQFYNEEKCREIIQAFTGKLFIKRRFYHNNTILEIDGYCKELNIGFEYNGEQHYSFNRRFHKTLEDLGRQKIRDEVKVQYCNNKNIALIIIPFNIAAKGDEELKHYIFNHLISSGVELNSKPNEITIKNLFNHVKPLEQLNYIAREKGGECLSTEYQGNKIKLKWQCKKGHIWDSKPNDIKDGHWCPICALEIRKYTIDNFKEIAIAKAGKCLSHKYINGKEKLEFCCNKGHHWKAAPKNILAGSWCPKCSLEILHRENKVTIEKIKEMAHKRGGQCLSESYISGQKKLLFKCNNEHIWEEKPYLIKQGNWCPECKK